MHKMYRDKLLNLLSSVYLQVLIKKNDFRSKYKYFK